MLQMYLPLSVYMHYYTHDTRHFWGRHGRDRMVVGFTKSTFVPVQSVPITTKVVS